MEFVNGDKVNVEDFGFGKIIYIDDENDKIDVLHEDLISKGQIREYDKKLITLKTK